jgi:hypothetical protein
MFHHHKTKTEQLTEELADQSDSLARTAASVAELLRERVVPVVGQATGNAKDWAKPRVEHGIEVAAPKLESAVNNLAPKVDTARDKIVGEMIPRIAEAISALAAASTAAKDEAVSRGQGAAAVISGDAVAAPKGRMKRLLLVLGALVAAGAAAFAFMKNSAPKDDPWTTPLADPYVATPNGRTSAAPVVDDAMAAATESEVIDPRDETGTLSASDGEDLADLDGAGDDSKSSAKKDDADKKPRG